MGLSAGGIKSNCCEASYTSPTGTLKDLLVEMLE